MGRRHRSWLVGFALIACFAATPALAERYAALVVDLDTDQVLFERYADASRYPASLTKLMTLYLTFQALEQGTLTLDQHLPVSALAAAQPPSKIGVKVGGAIPVRTAINALVVKSANDVAVVVAEALGGTESSFAQMMTDQARKLGMSRTTFRNASGLPDSGQISSARDMYRLARALITDYPQYYRLFSQTRFQYAGKTYTTHNRVMQRYAGADGMKTGYIRASGFNLITSAERNGVRLIGVVFGGRTGASRDAHMEELLDAGFALSAGPRVIPASTRPASLTATPIISASSGSGVPVGVPEQGSSDGGAWGVQVGAFAQAEAAERQARQALSALPSGFGQPTVDVVKTRRGQSVLYRACLRGFDQAAAAAACTALKDNRIDCLTLAPAG